MLTAEMDLIRKLNGPSCSAKKLLSVSPYCEEVLLHRPQPQKKNPLERDVTWLIEDIRIRLGTDVSTYLRIIMLNLLIFLVSSSGASFFSLPRYVAFKAVQGTKNCFDVDSPVSAATRKWYS